MYTYLQVCVCINKYVYKYVYIKSLNSYLTSKRSKQIQKMFSIRTQFKRAKYLGLYFSSFEVSFLFLLHIPAAPWCPAPWYACWPLNGELVVHGWLLSLVPPMQSLHSPPGQREEPGTAHDITMPWHVVPGLGVTI